MIDTDNIPTETVDITSLTLHDISKTTPSYTPERFEALKRSIEENGQIEAVLVYRNKIIDGRHRYKALQELEIPIIIIKKLHHNISIQELQALVESKEMRRHETKAQQAIFALKQMQISNANGNKMTQREAALNYGVTVKELGRANRICGNKKGQYNRPDLIDKLFKGHKVNIGTSTIPFLTDSLQSIINWLGKEEAANIADITGIASRDELSNDEEILVNQILNRVTDESRLVKQELANRLYIAIKEVED